MRTTRVEQDAAAIDDLDAALQRIGCAVHPLARGATHDPRREASVCRSTLHSMAVASTASVGALIGETKAKSLAVPRRRPHQSRRPRASRCRGVGVGSTAAANWPCASTTTMFVRSHVAARAGPGERPRARTDPQPGRESRISRPRSNAPTRRRCCARSRGEPGSATWRCPTLVRPSSKPGLVDDDGRPLETVELRSPRRILAARGRCRRARARNRNRPRSSACIRTIRWRTAGHSPTRSVRSHGARASRSPPTIPPTSMLPTRRDLDRALHLLGPADDFTSRAATITSHRCRSQPIVATGCRARSGS